MSDQTTDSTADQNTTDAETAPSWDDAFKGEDPAKVRDALDHAREWEKRSKENAAAAAELAAIKQSQKTTEERATERLAEIEERALQLTLKEARTDVSAETGIPVNILAGPEDSTPESIKAFAALLAAYTENVGKPRPPRPDANQGRSGTGSASTADQFAAAIEGSFTR